MQLLAKNCPGAVFSPLRTQVSCVPTPTRYSHLLAYARQRTYADFGILTSCVRKNGILVFLRTQSVFWGLEYVGRKRIVFSENCQIEVQQYEMLMNLLSSSGSSYLVLTIINSGLVVSIDDYRRLHKFCVILVSAFT